MKNKNLKKSFDWKLFIGILVIVYGIALVGNFFIGGETNSEWYQISKPSITPPNWIFSIVWNILFFLISISIYFAWKSASNKNDRLRVGFLFGVNLIANALWSVLFFGLQNPKLAFYDLILIWFSIANAMFLLWDMDRKASWLLLPYLLWVSFAGVLNWMFI
ncbi:TspO protein [Candidatus Pacearchaeota archaeon CG10_big_fil_rev_8_21_14_0_10_31_24]|nr:MAG: TspO protein [Candidatus Pacearchaeota archaeon CG10_big_fil_rev_8_21_14_0_10_31_24]